MILSMVKGTAVNEAVLTPADLRSKYGFKFNETQDSYYEQAILAAQKACEEYLGVDTLLQSFVCTEDFDTTLGQRYICLSAKPFLAVNTVMDGPNEVTDYRVNPRNGNVVLPYGATTTRVVVEYKVGFDSVPSDVLWCVAMTVQHMVRTSSASLMGKNSMTADGGSETYEQAVVPTAVRVHLDHYRQNRAL